MPIHEYKCLECGSLPEILLRTLDSQGVQCPVCGSDKLERLLSAIHALKTGASVPGTTYCGNMERCEMPPCSSEGTCRRDRK